MLRGKNPHRHVPGLHSGNCMRYAFRTLSEVTAEGSIVSTQAQAALSRTSFLIGAILVTIYLQQEK